MSQALAVHFFLDVFIPCHLCCFLNPWAQLLLQSVRKEGNTPRFGGALPGWEQCTPLPIPQPAESLSKTVVPKSGSSLQP